MFDETRHGPFGAVKTPVQVGVIVTAFTLKRTGKPQRTVLSVA